jgi:hypothetical protein
MESQPDQGAQAPKLNIGDDEDFEKAWWRVEVGVWLFLCAFLACAAAGLWGRGWLANASASSTDAQLTVRFERILRFKTPSRMEVTISPALNHDGRISLWVSRDLLKQLGMQQVIPQPDRSVPQEDGVTYEWASGTGNHLVGVAFDLQPEAPGMFLGSIQTDSLHRLTLRSIVLP